MATIEIRGTISNIYIQISIKTSPTLYDEVFISFTQTDGRMYVQVSGTTIVGVISFIMHDEFILHKVITIRPCLVRTFNHFSNWNISTNQIIVISQIFT
jgi:hypothetical protein